ncbi:hypothetical protein Xoosp13_111 [Xanthomonas phage Xoo-sp13]|nr:hypothetical protein Xoosp13_111 [Xanthomonas phage Xoo-sp13]
MIPYINTHLSLPDQPELLQQPHRYLVALTENATNKSASRVIIYGQHAQQGVHALVKEMVAEINPEYKSAELSRGTLDWFLDDAFLYPERYEWRDNDDRPENRRDNFDGFDSFSLNESVLVLTDKSLIRFKMRGFCKWSYAEFTLIITDMGEFLVDWLEQKNIQNTREWTEAAIAKVEAHSTKVIAELKKFHATLK